jgi:hypothetical protein
VLIIKSRAFTPGMIVLSDKRIFRSSRTELNLETALGVSRWGILPSFLYWFSFRQYR